MPGRHTNYKEVLWCREMPTITTAYHPNMFLITWLDVHHRVAGHIMLTRFVNFCIYTFLPLLLIFLA